MHDRLSTDSRARLTVIDIILFGVALFILSFLAQPMYAVLNANASALGTGEAYLFQLIFPALVMTIISVLYKTAATGGAQQ